MVAAICPIAVLAPFLIGRPQAPPSGRLSRVGYDTGAAVRSCGIRQTWNVRGIAQLDNAHRPYGWHAGYTTSRARQRRHAGPVWCAILRGKTGGPRLARGA